MAWPAPENLARTAMEAPPIAGYLASMDSDTQAAIAAMGDTILARMDHYFELQQVQFLEWRADLRGEMSELRGEMAELRAEMAELRAEVRALSQRVDRLEREVAQLRDYVTSEIGEIRVELRLLRARADHTDELRREIDALAVRVSHIERRLPD